MGIDKMVNIVAICVVTVSIGAMALMYHFSGAITQHTNDLKIDRYNNEKASVQLDEIYKDYFSD